MRYTHYYRNLFNIDNRSESTVSIFQDSVMGASDFDLRDEKDEESRENTQEILGKDTKEAEEERRENEKIAT